VTTDPDAHSYHDLAGWYDALYDARGKDYVAEARALLAVAREEGTDAPASLLDVACGTGRHLEVFRDEVAEVAGVDASAEMLEIAGGRLGQDVPLVEADLRSFDLGRTFDVVTCLFSSIGHVRDEAELDAAVASMAAHVAPGGTLLVEPWLTPGAVSDGHRDLVTATSADGVIARAGSSRREGDVLVVEFAWAVATVGGVATREERHRMPLFTAERYVAAVEHTGLAGTWRDDVDGLGTGRGLLVGHRRA
jgi:SAM-dependent methyltransferase